MRNLKRALSLLLSSTMVLGMVVMGGSAAGYQDVDASNDNQEAIEVLQAVGIMSGVDDAGNFNPDGSLTRNEMAVVMAHLLNLDYDYYRGVNTFTDVPDWAAPYVAACVAEGVTAGIGNGLYGGDQKITAAQAGLMVMKALGYFQNQEDFGGDWQVATIRQASYINLFDKVNSNAESALTRGQVAQLVLNGLKSDMVTFTGDKGVQIGDVTVGYHAEYTPKTNAAVKYNSINTGKTDIAGNNQYYIQLGEELYDGKLKLANGSDDFNRPSRVWSYDGKEIGTYAKKELMVASYTTGVTGKELYERLSSATIQDSVVFENYVDGAAGSIVKNDLLRSNNTTLAGTGTGVLTEVYLDSAAKEITIVSINTYLAKANSDYSETSESASLNVYIADENGESRTVDVEEVPSVANVVKDGFYLVNMTKKDNTRLEVVSLTDAKVMENSTVTKFSTDTTKVVDKLTVDGTEYKAAVKAFFDKETLDEYDQALLTDMSYNVYLDPYGNIIGVSLYEGTLNYVFITGYDRTGSNISIKTADAAAIFTDGSMENIKVNVTDTNKNIDKLDGKDENDVGNNTGDGKYYAAWGGTGNYALNRWYTYTVDSNNVYTLKPVGDGERMFASTETIGSTINCSNVRLDDQYNWNDRAYGNDNSVFITVEAGHVDNTSGNEAITEVSGVYTGVQNVDIEMTAAAKGDVAEANVYTLFDSDRYIIASIVLGEAQGSISNYAFILTDATSEGKDADGNYYWEFDAVMGGEKQTFTAKSKYPATINELDKGTVQELRFDGDYVVGVKDIPAADIYDTAKYQNGDKINDEEVYFISVDNTTSNEVIRLEGRTLYTDAFDAGLTLTSDAKAVVIQDENNETDVKTNFTTVAEAIAALGDPSTANGKQYKGDIIAVLNSQGVAEWVVFDSATPVKTGQDGGYTDNGTDTTLPNFTDLPVNIITGASNVSGQGRFNAATNTLSLLFDTNITTGASNINLNKVTVQDAFGKSVTVDIKDLDVQTNGDSYVYKMSFIPTSVPYNFGQSITVTALTTNMTVNEWYVDYGSSNVTFASQDLKVANTVGAEFSFTVAMPDGVTDYGVKKNTTSNVDQVSLTSGGSNITPVIWQPTGLTDDVTYTVELNAQARPVIDLGYKTRNLTMTSSVSGSVVKGVGIDALYFTAGEQSQTVTYNTSDDPVLTVVATSNLNTGDNKAVVTYTVNGVSTTKTIAVTASTSTTGTVTLPIGVITENTTIVVTGVKLQSKVSIADLTSSNASNLSSNATVAVKSGSAVVNNGDFVDVGTQLTVIDTVPVADNTDNINFTVGSVTKNPSVDGVETGNTLTFTNAYAVPVTPAANVVTAANG